MAESGQSAMKTRGKMWLSVAAWRDTCTMIILDRDYISFCTNKAKVTGKDLNLMQQRQRDRKAERNFIYSVCDALESGDIEAEVLIEMDPSRYFVSNKKAKHKVPVNFSSGNPNQEKIKEDRSTNCQAKLQKRRLKERRKYSFVTVVKKILIVKKKEQVPEDVEKEKINENPPHLVFITSMIKKCSGCDTKFTEKERKKKSKRYGLQVHDVQKQAKR